MPNDHEATRALRAQAELVQLVPDAVLVRDVATARILFWNNGAEALYGWSADEARGHISHDLLATEFVGTTRAAIEAHVAAHGQWHGELTHTRRDGARVTVDSRWAVQHDADGAPIAYLELNRDVTREREYEAEQQRLLRQAEEAETKFRGLLEAAPDGVVIVDGSGVIQLVNRQTEILFGYDRAALIGQRVEMLLPQRARSVHTAHREGYVSDPRTRPMGSGLELLGRRQDGSEFPVEISLSPMRSPESDGDGALVISTVRDVTARRRAEEQLKAAAADLARSNSELEQFAYVASHDLQEPLRMVASYTQLLSRRYAGKLDEDADEFIGFAVDGAKRMQDLINDLLAYSRVGTRALQLERIEANDVVDQVARDLAPTTLASGGSVSRDELPTVYADPTQLRQLFQNLIANGLKFSRPNEPPRVHVAAERDGQWWRFGVRDNGIGIEPQYVDRIFALFQRLHTRDEYPGTGIGLAICKKIVERHGGDISVQSELGAGTTFWFRLPARPAATEQAA
jgi:PAS domain S-box-containing protein